MTQNPPHNAPGPRTDHTAPGAEADSLPPRSSDASDVLPAAKLLTRARARDLGYLLLKYGRRHLPKKSGDGEEKTPPPRPVAGAFKLRYLKVIPWLLLALFGFSFLWDFDGMSAVLFGQLLTFEGLLRILAVSGLIGFGTNWLAITMLFQPREKRPIFGQGLIPSQKERVIYRLALAISKELINEEVIKQKIQESGAIRKYRDTALTVSRGILEDPEFRSDIKLLTARYIDEILQSPEVRQKLVDLAIAKLEQYAGHGLGGLALKAYRYFRHDDLADKIDAAIRELPHRLDTVLDEMDRYIDRLPARIEERSEDLERYATRAILGFVETLDVYDMIISNMEKYDEAQLETLLKNTSNEHFNYIKYLGGILGFFGGFVIWNPPLALAVFGVAGAALYALDEALYRRRPDLGTRAVDGDR